jgi:hypothetical protein
MKAVSVVLALILLVPLAQATVKGAVESFYVDDAPDVVVANQQNVDDLFAAFAFVNEFGLKNFTPVSKLRDAPLVIIGGPCANSLWAEYAPDTCEDWQYPEGKALIISHQTAAGKTVILIGGTTGKDTRAAAKFVTEKFSDPMFANERVVLDTAGLPLAKETLKVYRTENNLGEGESSAKGEVVIEIPDDASGGTQDLADGLQKYLEKSFPFATIEQSQVSDTSLSSINGKILIALKDPPLISVEDDAPSAHVVIASAGAFWLSAQGYKPGPTQTHNVLVNSDLKFQ